jgi:hypothetical protein
VIVKSETRGFFFVSFTKICSAARYEKRNINQLLKALFFVTFSVPPIL